MPISGGSAMEFETKKKRSNYFRSVNTIINDGPAAQPEWDKVPITFTEEKLKSAIHNDDMVIEVNIARWIIGKVLVDNKFGRHFVPKNIREDEPEPAHVAPARIPITRFRRKAN
jgi:hypothetical protein